ncbi:anti-sigma factor family protein [Phosphitispora fastidiosa]|uniref:anti-sigma factor family protein n=1 Tax=Phosphitispora fastidiosa TaxID=2837202 RepID=UPI001E2A041D|nr:anti-sigma factor [Phosphitispora fastidiosa]MBU7007257.1 anti-sigma factor RsiW [Phosphitispora fastidiosa]
MQCREWKKKIPHYLAGELSEDECAAFENHLNDCRYCREELASFREVDFLIDAACIAVPEIDLTAVIMKQVNAENHPESRAKSYGKSNVKSRGKRTVAVLQDLVTAAAAALILFWFSGPALSGGEFPVDADRVIRVSDTVGGAFQSYVDFSVATTNKLSASMKQISPIEMKGDE